MKINNISSIPFGQLKDSILVVKVGSNERPASIEDINDFSSKLGAVFEDFEDLRVIVTHHAVNFELLGTKVLRREKKT